MRYRTVPFLLATLIITGFFAVQSSRVLAQTTPTTTTNNTESKTDKSRREKLNFRAQNDILYYDEADCASSPAATVSGAGGDCKGQPLPDTIPEYWRNLIDNAAASHPDTDRRLVAATLWIENRGWPDPNKNWATSPASAKGPWQFIPSSWASMGEDCNHDGKKDINDPEDAVCAAFNHLKGSACKPILEGATGNADSDFASVPFKRDGNNTLMSALASYNGSGTRDGVPLGQQGGGENSNYVRMGYWLIQTGFKQTINEETGERIDATASSGGSNSAAPNNNSSNGSSNSGSCASSSNATGSVVTINGFKYAFPVVLPKNDVTNGTGWPCPGICHHDGTPAFDLSKNATDDTSTGTAEVAIADGTIESLDTYMGIDGCFEFQLKAADGYYYYYTHSSSPTVQVGSTVSAGQHVAEIGRRACTGNGSYPHLHIDRGSPKGNRAGSVCCRDSGMVPLINELYDKLGQNL